MHFVVVACCNEAVSMKDVCSRSFTLPRLIPFQNLDLALRRNRKLRQRRMRIPDNDDGAEDPGRGDNFPEGRPGSREAGEGQDLHLGARVRVKSDSQNGRFGTWKGGKLSKRVAIGQPTETGWLRIFRQTFVYYEQVIRECAFSM